MSENNVQKPDETGKIKMEGHVLIKDKNTGEVLVDQKMRNYLKICI